jgi:hypothetical protein
MTTHPSLAAGLSQCDLILARLQQTPGEWVPMPALVKISRGYACHSRIADLRRRGCIIDHRNLRFGKKIHSQYRLSDASPI